MFKFLGAVMILLCTTFLSSKKVIEFYYTHKFISKAMEIVRKIGFERNSNLIYEKIYKKLGFNKDMFLADMEKNSYINKEIKSEVQDFFFDLGKKNKSVEDEYIDCFLKKFADYKTEYYQKYMQNKKLYILYGLSLGLFLIIILI